MLVKVKRGWEIPESEATPEAAFLNRRNLLKAMGMGSLAAAAGAMLPARAAFAADEADPSAGLYPADRKSVV